MPNRDGKIITFYSYKGGTGRSMTTANIAWIMASVGKKVLVIDWDLEAPGLNRYFYPFLLDPKLTSKRGLIDLIWNYSDSFAGADGIRKRGKIQDELCNFQNEAVTLQWEFQNDGQVDFLCPGAQNEAYGSRVNSFDWKTFYENLSGWSFLEKVRKTLKYEYDYVLIDSRTGVSDTSGICTVQMPDILVVFATLNNQSIDGCRQVALSVSGQRKKSNRPVTIWPVLTRIDNSESKILEMRKTYAQEMLGEFITDHDKEAYWSQTQIPYKAYYSYFETLAVFKEDQNDSLSPLRSMVSLTGYITAHRVKALIVPGNRDETVRNFETAEGAKQFISHGIIDVPFYRRFWWTILPVVFFFVGYFLYDNRTRDFESYSRITRYTTADEVVIKIPVNEEIYFGILDAQIIFPDSKTGFISTSIHIDKFDEPVEKTLYLFGSFPSQKFESKILLFSSQNTLSLTTEQPGFEIKMPILDDIVQIDLKNQEKLKLKTFTRTDSLVIINYEGSFERQSPNHWSLDLISSRNDTTSVPLEVVYAPVVNSLKLFVGHQGHIQHVEFSPDGLKIASAGADKTIRLWTLDGKLYQTLLGHENGVSCVKFLSTTTLVSSGWDWSIYRWSINSSSPLLKPLTIHSAGITSIGISGNSVISSSYDRTIRITELNTQQSVVLSRPNSWPQAVATTSEYIAAGGRDQTVTVWHRDNSSEVAKWTLGSTIWCLAFSPDGKILAAGTAANSIVLVEVTSGEIIRTMSVEGGSVWSIAFSPSGLFMVSGGTDSSLIIWEVDSGERVKVIKQAHSDYISGVAWSNRNDFIVSCSFDGTIKLWPQLLTGFETKIDVKNNSNAGKKGVIKK
ncbi:AAA family ATPase [bacterium]|nr:MAG: AAA family ATPase [bacterium]